jgi:hypothetical protein
MLDSIIKKTFLEKIRDTNRRHRRRNNTHSNNVATDVVPIIGWSNEVVPNSIYHELVRWNVDNNANLFGGSIEVEVGEQDPIEEEESTEPIRTVDVNNMHMP